MKKPEEVDPVNNLDLIFRPREKETVPVEIPKDTLASLQKVAATRDMSSQALIKFYIGQGLRNDLARLFGDQVLETATEVLKRHIQSEEEVSSIIREIQTESVHRPAAA